MSDSTNFTFDYCGKSVTLNLPMPKDHIQNQIINSKNFYEIDLLEEIGRLPLKDGIICDIGANIGNHTVYFSSILKRDVFAFEPNKIARDILDKNIELNDLSHKVKVFQVGLGAEETQGSMDINTTNLGASRLSVVPNGEVIIKTLDSFITKDIKVSLLKIDVEGFEVDVLEGAKETIKNNKPLIVIETQTHRDFLSISEKLYNLEYIPFGQKGATNTVFFIHKENQLSTEVYTYLQRIDNQNYNNANLKRYREIVQTQNKSTAEIKEFIETKDNGEILLKSLQEIKTQVLNGSDIKEKELIELRKQIHELYTSVYEKNLLIATLKAIFMHKEEHIKDNDKAFVIIKNYIHKLELRNQKLEKKLSILYSSKTWKISSRIRRMIGEKVQSFEQYIEKINSSDGKVESYRVDAFKWLPLVEENHKKLIKTQEKIALEVSKINIDSNFQKNCSSIVKSSQSVSQVVTNINTIPFSNDRISDTGIVPNVISMEPVINILPLDSARRRAWDSGLPSSQLIHATYKTWLSRNEKLPNSEIVCSVIITSYNKGQYLEESLSSILSQTVTNIEIIIVDDKSADNSIDIINKFAASDKRIKPCFNIFNKGTYYSRNIGLKMAKGHYVTFLDADDASHPKRLEIQLSNMIQNTQIIASYCFYKRFGTNWEVLKDKSKECLASLMFKRIEVLNKVGYFDDVRYGADSEFVERLIATFGSESVKPISEKLYFARYNDGSLTTSGKGKIFNKVGDRVSFQKADDRVEYVANYRRWHQDVKNSTKSPYVFFPQLQRHFKAPKTMSSYEPLFVTASIASFPPRIKSLELVVQRILPQVNQLNVYLNNYNDVPIFLNHKKIKVYKSENEIGDLKDNGKFFKANDLKKGYHFTLDDDIMYPKNYIQNMILEIEKFNKKAIIGVHGVNYSPNTQSYIGTDRQVFHFTEEHTNHLVDSLGTGTTAYYTESFSIKLSDLMTTGTVDLWFANKAKETKTPMITAVRSANWLAVIEVESTNLYIETKNNENRISKLFCDNLINKLINPIHTYLYYNWYVNNFNNALPRAYGITDKNERYKWVDGNEVKTVNIAVLINGWNCGEYAFKAINSVFNQLPGRYTFEVHVYDDASDDNTFEQLSKFTCFKHYTITKGIKNMGPAHARHQLIGRIEDKETICVLLDLDDELSPNALASVADRYINNKDCWLTSGNWQTNNGQVNPLPFYSNDVLDNQMHRDVEKFHFAPLRTFKRFLYDVVDELDLKDDEGNWLMFCSDVALIYPLLDQCSAKNVEFIEDILYIYNSNRDTGTLKKYGKPEKLKIEKQLKKRSKKNLHEL